MILTQEKKLIKDTKRIVKHHNEVSKLKGETFNVFSILKMEHKENNTHSAFLGELLNPKGTHLKGNLFLKLFLKRIGNNKINLDAAKVTLEKHLGKRDDIKQKGGRADIYITDKTNSICIENKIYATDQNLQVQRYCNHNLGFNTVFYLTLNGLDATEKSSGNLKKDEDYYCISYQKEIIEWLTECLKESAEEPILRETIRQYIILIKKLTNQLSDKVMEKEMQKLVKENYNAAQTISNVISKVELEETKEFVNQIVASLDNELEEGWNIVVDDDISQPWKGISISHNSWIDNIVVKLEGESKMPWQNSIYGIKAHKNLIDRNQITSKLEKDDIFHSAFKQSDAWAYYKHLLYFSDVNERGKLFDTKKREDLIKNTVDKLVALCKASKLQLTSLK